MDGLHRIITEDERRKIIEAEEARFQVIQVDSFGAEEFLNLQP